MKIDQKVEDLLVIGLKTWKVGPSEFKELSLPALSVIAASFSILSNHFVNKTTDALEQNQGVNSNALYMGVVLENAAKLTAGMAKEKASKQVTDQVISKVQEQTKPV